MNSDSIPQVFSSKVTSSGRVSHPKQILSPSPLCCHRLHLQQCVSSCNRSSRRQGGTLFVASKPLFCPFLAAVLLLQALIKTDMNTGVVQRLPTQVCSLLSWAQSAPSRRGCVDESPGASVYPVQRRRFVSVCPRGAGSQGEGAHTSPHCWGTGRGRPRTGWCNLAPLGRPTLGWGTLGRFLSPLSCTVLP